MKPKDTWLLHYCNRLKNCNQEKKNSLELQTAGIVDVDLQLLKAVNKRHLKIVLTNSIVIIIITINNCDKQMK